MSWGDVHSHLCAMLIVTDIGWLYHIYYAPAAPDERSTFLKLYFWLSFATTVKSVFLNPLLLAGRRPGEPDLYYWLYITLVPLVAFAMILAISEAVMNCVQRDRTVTIAQWVAVSFASVIGLTVNVSSLDTERRVFYTAMALLYIFIFIAGSVPYGLRFARRETWLRPNQQRSRFVIAMLVLLALIRTAFMLVPARVLSSIVFTASELVVKFAFWRSYERRSL